MIDPFLYDENVLSRLRREHAKHSRLIVAVDFDDTVFPWTHKDSAHSLVLSVVKRAQAAGFYIVIFTASDKDRYDFIRSYMKECGITVDSINENPIPLPYGNNGKIYYNIFLDDRAGLKTSLRNLSVLLDEIENGS